MVFLLTVSLLLLFSFDVFALSLNHNYSMLRDTDCFPILIEFVAYLILLAGLKLLSVRVKLKKHFFFLCVGGLILLLIFLFPQFFFKEIYWHSARFESTRWNLLVLPVGEYALTRLGILLTAFGLIVMLGKSKQSYRDWYKLDLPSSLMLVVIVVCYFVELLRYDRYVVYYSNIWGILFAIVIGANLICTKSLARSIASATPQMLMLTILNVLCIILYYVPTYINSVSMSFSKFVKLICQTRMIHAYGRFCIYLFVMLFILLLFKKIRNKSCVE